MPSVNVLLEVIGGPKKVVAIDPGCAASRTAEVLAAAVDRTLVDDEGRSRGWKLYTPTEGGGFEVVNPDGNLLVISMAMRKLLESGKEGGFGGHGEHDGDRYLFRLRLFVPARVVSAAQQIERASIREEEAIDLTDIEAAPEIKGRRPKGTRKKKDEEGPAPPPPRPPEVGPATAGALVVDPSQERVAMPTPAFGVDGTLLISTGLARGEGTQVMATTVEARAVSPGAIGPAPERPRRAGDTGIPREAKASGAVGKGRSHSSTRASPKRAESSGGGAVGLLAALAILGAVAAGGWLVLKRGENPSAPVTPAPSAATPAPVAGTTPRPTTPIPPAAGGGRISDKLSFEPMPGGDPGTAAVLGKLSAMGLSAMGLSSRAALQTPAALEALRGAEKALGELCGGAGGVDACEAWSTVALATFHGCQNGGCEPGGPEPHLKVAAIAAERGIPMAAALIVPARKQEATRRLLLQAVRLGGLAPASVSTWAPTLSRLGHQACGDAKLKTMPDCIDLARVP